MKTTVIKEFGNFNITSAYELDLTTTPIKDCLGCVTCWFKTPGKCVYRDLDEFLKNYLASDKVVIFSKVKKGFISGNLKTILDRMIPLFHANIDVSTGECRHVPRYDKYPDIEFYYDGDFVSPEDCNIVENYIYRTFDLFESNNVLVKPISEYKGVTS